MAAIFLASVPAILGCSQEGKTVQTQLPVQGVAYTAIFVDTLPSDTILTMNVRFKVQTQYFNGCEARGGIEIHSETNPSLFVLTPLARYTVDEACNIGISGDTVQTLNVNAIIMKFSPTPDPPLSFEVRGANAPPVEIQLSLDSAELLDSTRWEVRVQDAATAAPLAGAIVRIEDASGPEVYGEGPADANGLYVLERGCTGVVGEEDIHYVVKVSYSGRTAVLRMGSQPARCRRLESVFVRVP
jgi:hypothetical protein